MLYTREVTVQVPGGLHHQAVTRFIQTANRFDSTLRIAYGGNNVNAKSMLGVLSLSVGAGAQITLTAEGPDAEAALGAADGGGYRVNRLLLAYDLAVQLLLQVQQPLALGLGQAGDFNAGDV